MTRLKVLRHSDGLIPSQVAVWVDSEIGEQEVILSRSQFVEELGIKVGLVVECRGGRSLIELPGVDTSSGHRRLWVRTADVTKCEEG